MAEKNNSAKKTTGPKKATVKKKSESVVAEDSVLGTNVPVNDGSIKVDAAAAEEALNAIDTTIKIDDISKEKITKDMEEAIKPLTDIAKKIQEVNEAQTEFNKTLSENPNKAEELIQNEIKRVEAIKEKVEKIIKPADSTAEEHRNIRSSTMTSWWNGMGYDI